MLHDKTFDKLKILLFELHTQKNMLTPPTHGYHIIFQLTF